MQTMIPPVGTQAGLMFADDPNGHHGTNVFCNGNDDDHHADILNSVHANAVQLGVSTTTLASKIGDAAHRGAVQLSDGLHNLSQQIGHLETGAIRDICQTKHDLNVEIQKSRAEILLNQKIDSAKNELLAAQNHAALSAALAACCCEIKELVRAEVSQTRELVRDLDHQKTRDELSELKMQMLLAKKV